MKHSYYLAAKAKARARIGARTGRAAIVSTSAGKPEEGTKVTGKAAGGYSWGQIRKIRINSGDIIEVEASVLARAVNEQRAIEVLGAAMAAAKEPVAPELARSVQAQDNWWRTIKSEFPSLSSREVAELFGASGTNRNFASQQRRDGKLLGYTRGKATLFPAFQFDRAKAAVRPVIPQLLEVTRRHEIPDEDLVLWMATRSTLFPEQDRPVDHLDDPTLLLAAAESHFGATW